MNNEEVKARQVNEALKNLYSRETLLTLFREILGFAPPSLPYFFPQIEKVDIETAEIIAELGTTKVFYIKFPLTFDDTYACERKIRHLEREIIKAEKDYRRDNIFVFSDSPGTYWDFVYPAEYGRRLVLKRFTLRPDNRDKLRTPSLQLAKLAVSPGEESQIPQKLELAFSVEAVSQQFFEEYEKIFNEVKQELLKQSPDRERVHRFVHQLLNRLMFLYFVQRRGVFKGNKNFLATFWNTYRNYFEGKNEFYDKWLKVLFFKALNKEFPPPHHDYPYFRISDDLDFNKILRDLPYLNGGLFREDLRADGIDSLAVKIPDRLFVKIFDFLESYNFTARENTPLDEDLEIDPEMLGYIYESMVNVSELESEDERHKLGIFYTPRTEIDFMLRRSLVEFLFNKTKLQKSLLYQFVFPEMEEEKIPQFSREDARKLYEVLDEITIVDPACGSGHYLVVAVQILCDLKKTLWMQMGNSEESFKAFHEKRKIIERSIFGVDIKEWAVEIAKLRLWLDLLVSAEDEQLKPSETALLPNLSFKIRVGDSLVQQVGGKFFPVKKFAHHIPSSLQYLKNQLLQAKKAYFEGREGVDENWVKNLEMGFFKALLEVEIERLKSEVERSKASSIKEFSQQLQLIRSGSLPPDLLESKLPEKEQKKIERWQEEIRELEEEKDALRDRKYAFWPIEFAEVLSGRDGEGGFDIVIANPPYVRQEKIEDPQKPNDKNSAKLYKQNLLQQIREDWNDNSLNLSKRSDLYVYFYLKGLQLLNPDGVMCYISSNSWLDVDYGAELQEILLRRVPIIAIYDNEKKRSFKQALVNTVIAVFGAPRRDWQGDLKEHKVKFVMFKKPFEEVCFSEILWQIDSAKEERMQNEYFRLIQKSQWALYLEGIEEDEGKELGREMGKYQGNKWGGKYLRAPEIYWRILEKGKDKLVRLGDIAEVRFGIKTGANEFFYLKPMGKSVKEVAEIAEKDPGALIEVENDAGWRGEIEAEFLRPVIKSPRELKTIMVRLEDLNYLVLLCHKDKRELKGKRVLEYIQWGEKQGFHQRPTCKSRPRWWDLGEREGAPVIVSEIIREKYLVCINNSLVLEDKTMYGVKVKRTEDARKVAYLLNSQLTRLIMELSCRPLPGIADIDVNVWEDVLLLSPELTSEEEIAEGFLKRQIHSIFTELGFDPKRPIREQEPNPLPDRKALDDIVFDALGLTEEERKEVYWTVAELVQKRLQKEKSV